MRDSSEIWTGKAISYDRARPTPPPALLDLLTQLIQMPHPALVVDLGSGTGLSTAIWGERASRVIGIEPNADMRKEAVRDISPCLKGRGFSFSRTRLSCFNGSRPTSFRSNGSYTPSTGIDGEPLRKNVSGGIGIAIVNHATFRTCPFTHVQG
jgi:hypothetical protein